MEFRRTEMASPGQLLSRIFLWTYERGSWQYDLAVIAILIFVLLTPGRWFHDQPSREVPAPSAQVELLSRALQRTQSELQSGRFEITSVEAIRDAQGAVIAYEITLHKK